MLVYQRVPRKGLFLKGQPSTTHLAGGQAAEVSKEQSLQHQCHKVHSTSGDPTLAPQDDRRHPQWILMGFSTMWYPPVMFVIPHQL